MDGATVAIEVESVGGNVTLEKKLGGMCVGRREDSVCLEGKSCVSVLGGATPNFLSQEIHMKMDEIMNNCYIKNFLKPKSMGGSINSGLINS